MRIAFVRGASLNPWELQNYAGLGDELVAFASRSGNFELDGVSVPVRRLPSTMDALRHLPALGRGAIMRFGGPPEILFGLERALAGFDIAHVAELDQPYSAQALRARDAGRIRRVVATVWENIPLKAPENPYVERRTATVAAGVDHFVAITERARVHLEMAGVERDRITVQPMGIDLERFTPRDAPHDDSGPLRVLAVNRLVSEKGVEDIVLAAGLLRERGVPVHVTFVGDGPLRDRCREIARVAGVADDVVLAGPRPYADLPGLYRAADVFVLASGPRDTWREQFGFAVVEAMASGLPVIAGHSGSLPEVVADPDSLVVPHDPFALADRLERLAGDPGERRRQGARNRAFAEERYDRRQVGAALAQLYSRVLDDR